MRANSATETLLRRNNSTRDDMRSHDEALEIAARKAARLKRKREAAHRARVRHKSKMPAGGSRKSGHGRKAKRKGKHKTGHLRHATSVQRLKKMLAEKARRVNENRGSRIKPLSTNKRRSSSIVHAVDTRVLGKVNSKIGIDPQQNVNRPAWQR